MKGYQTKINKTSKEKKIINKIKSQIQSSKKNKFPILKDIHIKNNKKFITKKNKKKIDKIERKQKNKNKK